MHAFVKPICLAVALASHHAASSAQDTKVSEPGRYVGYSEKLYESWERSSFYVAVRDGTKLAVDLYRPAKGGEVVETRYPVVWMHTPYQRGVLSEDGTVQLSGMNYMDARDLTHYGYVFAVVDTRGKGASFGSRRGMLDTTEARDAYDITEWLAQQPWSDGQIGMTGCSYVGGTQDNAAIATPPHLKAITPGAAPFDRYGFVSRGGLTAQFQTRPEDPRDAGVNAMPVDADPGGTMMATAKADHARNSIMADIWKDIPFRDDYSQALESRFWEESSLSTYRNRVEMDGPAMLRWTGWKDELSGEQFLAHANLRNVVKIIIGPETHCRSEQFNMFAEHLRFFDRYLKGVDNGYEREPSIHYYTYNTEPGQEWARSDVWPIAGTRMQRLYLSAAPDGAGLTQNNPAAGEVSFTTDYSVITGSGETLLWPAAPHGRGLSFETAAFDHDMRITGHPVVSLKAALSTADGDIFAYLEEVAPDGSSEIRSHGRIRASHRAPGTAPYDNLGLPYHRSFRRDYRPIVPHKAEELRFDLLPTSTIVKKGYRLRLVVTGADSRQRTYLDRDPPPSVTLHMGEGHGSYVEIPVVPLDPVAPPQK